MSLDVGAAIVNYNAGSHLLACVDSLLGEGVSDIVVVDNGSSDDSLSVLTTAHPNVPVISRPDNPGLGTSMNRGVRELNNDTLLLLNPDTVLSEGSLEPWMKALDSDPSVGMVGPRLENVDGSLYPSARRFPSLTDGIGHALLGLFHPTNAWSKRYKMLDRDPEVRTGVDWVSGAAMLVKRPAWEAVGGFDEGFFMYLEDVDLCRRLRDAGWEVLYEPDARVTHVQGVSTDRTPYKMILAHHRSLLRYYRLSAKGADRFAFPLVAAGLAVRFPVACAHRALQGRRSR